MYKWVKMVNWTFSKQKKKKDGLLKKLHRSEVLYNLDEIVSTSKVIIENCMISLFFKTVWPTDRN